MVPPTPLVSLRKRLGRLVRGPRTFYWVRKGPSVLPCRHLVSDATVLPGVLLVVEHKNPRLPRLGSCPSCPPSTKCRIREGSCRQRPYRNRPVSMSLPLPESGWVPPSLRPGPYVAGTFHLRSAPPTHTGSGLVGTPFPGPTSILHCRQFPQSWVTRCFPESLPR